MADPKRRMLDSLSMIHTDIYNTKEYLADTSTKNNANRLSEIYDRLNQSESALAQILDENWWEQN